MEIKRYIQLNGLKTKTEINHKVELIKNIAGSNYVWNESNKQIFKSLLFYFHGDKRAEKYNIDLNKSIALIGGYGVGKTTIFNIMRRYLSTILQINPNGFRISSIEEVISEMGKTDFMNSVLLYNTRPCVLGSDEFRPINVLINEFGFRYDIKSFGTDVNQLIDAFMMKRYDIFQQQFKHTHITSNLDTNQLTSEFHIRLVDRFKEMFNIIELEGESFRR